MIWINFSQLASFFVRLYAIFFSLHIPIIFYISLFSHFSLIIAKSLLSLLSAICFDNFTAWYSVLLSVRQMTCIGIAGKISLIIHLTQYTFPDASISAIASAKLWGLCYFQMHQTRKLYILLGKHLLTCL